MNSVLLSFLSHFPYMKNCICKNTALRLSALENYFHSDSYRSEILISSAFAILSRYSIGV